MSDYQINKFPNEVMINAHICKQGEVEYQKIGYQWGMIGFVPK